MKGSESATIRAGVILPRKKAEREKPRFEAFCSFISVPHQEKEKIQEKSTGAQKKAWAPKIITGLFSIPSTRE